MILFIIIAVVVIALIWLIAAYNSLVRKNYQVKEAWSDIEVQLKRRYDLIPNLLETIKGYARHEKEVFDKVTQARAAAIGARTIKEHAQAEGELASTLKSLFAVAEAYPELKANQNFLELQQELTDTEDKIQAARRFYNSTVLDLNTAVESFPTNLIASRFNFQKSEFFDMPEEEKQTPKIKF